MTTSLDRSPGARPDDIDLDRYRAEGFLELGRRLEKDDVAAITRLFDDLDDAPDLAPSWEAQYDDASDGRRRLRKLRRLVWNDPALFAPILARAGVPDLAEAVVGPDAVVVFHAAFLKPARIGSAVGLHQDQALWSRDLPGAFSVWIALTDVAPANGGLAGRPGSHARLHEHRDDPDHPWHPTLAAVADEFAAPHEFVLGPGDAVIWDRLFAHSSGANLSSLDRRGMVVVLADGGKNGAGTRDVMGLDELRRHAGV